jgi:hypothetical protein
MVTVVPEPIFITAKRRRKRLQLSVARHLRNNNNQHNQRPDSKHINNSCKNNNSVSNNLCTNKGMPKLLKNLIFRGNNYLNFEV